MKSDLTLTQSENYKRFLENCGWKAIRLSSKLQEHQYIYLWKLKPFSLTLLRGYGVDETISLEQIETIKKSNNIYSIRLETRTLRSSSQASKFDEKLIGFGYRRDNWCHFPSKTSVLDITPSLEAIYTSFRPTSRNRLNRVRRENPLVNIVGGKTLLSNNQLYNEFRSLLNKSSKKLGLYLYPDNWIRKLLECFQKESFVVYIKKNDRMVSMTYFVVIDKIIYYVYSASTLEANKNAYPTLIVWSAIKEGKKTGCEKLDFFGIYDNKYHESTFSWKGFSKFKNGFGGVEKEYLGSYSKYSVSNSGETMITILKKLGFYKLLPSLYPEPMSLSMDK